MSHPCRLCGLYKPPPLICRASFDFSELVWSNERHCVSLHILDEREREENG